MNNISIILFSIFFLSYSEFSNLNANDNDILTSEDHCVAYSTPEKILFFPEYQVIGKSCEIKARMENNLNQSRFVVSFPLESLDSGISSRDDDVMEILDAANFPNVFFKTSWLSKEQINKILSDGKGDVNGTLVVSGNEYYISIRVFIFRKREHFRIKGSFGTNYSFFNLTPPKLGFFAEVLNIINIFFNLKSEKIIDFEKDYK